jgi:hypothetical protein
MTEPTFDFDGGGLGRDLGVPGVVIPKKTLPPRWAALTQVPIVIGTGLRPVLGKGIGWIDIGIFQPHPNQPRSLTVAVDGSRY